MIESFCDSDCCEDRQREIWVSSTSAMREGGRERDERKCSYFERKERDRNMNIRDKKCLMLYSRADILKYGVLEASTTVSNVTAYQWFAGYLKPENILRL